jgi:hypothetical protein
MAFSIITWNRLEPLDQTSDLRVALGAPIADPLWLLHRQWQFGELDGNDAGTPIAVTIQTTATPLSRYRPGDAETVDWSPTDTPLEPLVEAERVRGLPEQHRRLAAETGAHFVRMLTLANMPTVARAVRQRFALLVGAIPDARADAMGAEAAVLLAGRAVDGDAVAAALGPGRRPDGRLGSLPAGFPGGVAVLPVATEWLAWYDALLVEPPNTPGPTTNPSPAAWNPRRFEYRFATSDGSTTFVASAFDDGHLDWPDLDADDSVDLGGQTPATVGPPAVAIPVPLTYPGMPAHRYWEIEDGRVDFGALQAGSTDIVRMLLTDFALVYGEDWFLVPMDVPVGAVVRIVSMQVRDTFGEVSTVMPTVGDTAIATTGQRPWSMYRTTAVSGPALGLDVLFVPPSLAATWSGPPIEEVAFFRDEMANIVWAVERTVPSALGTPVDRYRTSQPASVVTVPVDVTDLGDAEVIYRLATPVPDNWYPYLARRTPSGDDITLERLAASDPLGAIARESSAVEDEEVTRGGLVVQRAWQFARWTGGQPVLWFGRRVTSGRGEGSSGLHWDATEPIA